jgi:protein O-mannosyl-transferase
MPKHPTQKRKAAPPVPVKEVTPSGKVRPLPSLLNSTPVILLIIILACVAVYFHTLSYGFSFHDDNIIVLDNQAFLKNPANVAKAIVSDAWFRHKEIELYRPLQNVSFMVDAWIGKDIIRTTHMTNFILHVLSCLSVFFLLGLLGFHRKYALLGALVYAVHFLFLHAVIWIPARGDLLLSLFSFLSMITFILAVRHGKWYYYLLNVIMLALALFAKETAVMLPVIFLVYLYLFGKKKIFTRGNLVLAVSWLAVFILFYYLRDLSITKDEQSIGLGPFFLNIQTIPETILKLFVPVNFSTMPSFSLVATLLGVMITAAFFLLFFLRKDLFGPAALFGMIWFACFLLPGMAYRPNFASFTYEYLDHRAYLPSFGMIMIFLMILQRLEIISATGAAAKIILAGSVLALVYLGFMNYLLHGIYRNPTTYSESAITANTHCALGYFIHGNEMYQVGKKDTALSDFTNAVKYYPKFYDARFNKAMVLSEKKKYPESQEELDYIVQYKPDLGPKVYNLRGVVRIKLENNDGAMKDFETALQMDPNYPEAKKNLDLLRRTQTNREEFYKYLNEAERLNEDGVTLAKNGDYKEAMKLFERSFAKDPTYYKAVTNIGNCLHAMGNTKGACEKWKIAADHGNKGAQDLLNQYCK